MFTPNADFDAMFDAGLVAWDEHDLPVPVPVQVQRVTSRTVAERQPAS
jgi:hypothetical protein